MSRRGRAIGFAIAAALCAGLAASAGGPRAEVAAELGPLRSAVVAIEPLPARRALREQVIRSALELRRVPERFLPPDALSDPAQALGRAPTAPVPAGGYLLGSQLEVPGSKRPRTHRLASGRRPVEITVAAAGALAARPGAGPQRVDVVVTSEPGPGGGAGRTYVAAKAVELIELGPTGEPGAGAGLPGSPADAWTATLALTREQALRLIHAESFARSVRLIGR